MTNDHPTDIHTFRFGSGQVLRLAYDIIRQIPYLDGLVSFAQHSPTALNVAGHLKLDPNIDFNHFRLITKTLPFESLAQALIRLPQYEDVATILLLMDYLGLLPTPYPTLDEIDSSFLFALNSYRRYSSRQYEVNVPMMQDMAAHFVFALVRGDYDRASDQTIAQVQWCAMFITQANGFFHPTLRHHVHTVTEHYLHTVSPSPSQPLQPVPCQERTARQQALRAIRSSISRPFALLSPCIPSDLNADDYDFVFEYGSPYLSYRYDKEKSIVNAVSDEIFDSLETKIWSSCLSDTYDLRLPVRQSGKS